MWRASVGGNDAQSIVVTLPIDGNDKIMVVQAFQPASSHLEQTTPPNCPIQKVPH
jgi:hypothetical protein